VLAWGNNQAGMLGDGTAPADHHTPVHVLGLGPGSGVVKVVAGFSSAYALERDGHVVAWGNNRKGETGSGDAPTQHRTPTAVQGLSGIVDIAAGWEHGLALAGNGNVYGWGDNSLGQIGDGTTVARSAPVSVSGFGAGSNVVAVFAGGFHSHALVGTPAPPTTTTPGGGGGSTTVPGSTTGSTGPRSTSRSTRKTAVPTSPVAKPVTQVARTTG